MIYRKIGKTGMEASVVSLGTWAAGGDSAWGASDDAAAIEAIRVGVDNGINLIDTAPAYGLGHSERIVGKALKGKRSDVLISTKCGLRWDTEEGSFLVARDGIKIVRNLSKKSIMQEAETSLKNLETDYIDIYITHWQSVEPFAVLISETMEALLELKKEGKIRAIGVANATTEQVAEYKKYGQIDLIQERYSILTRNNVESDILPLCENNDITLQAYMPLEQGLLTGKITMDTVISDLDIRNKLVWYKPENRIKVIHMLDGWKSLCKNYNCELSHIVIAWTFSRSQRINVLCGGRKQAHVLENTKAGGLILTGDDMKKMDSDIKKLHASLATGGNGKLF